MHIRIQTTVSSENRPIVLKNRILSNEISFVGFDNDLDITAVFIGFGILSKIREGLHW